MELSRSIKPRLIKPRSVEAKSIEGRLLFQNEACLVINKLPGESSESQFDDPAMADRRLYCVHRLDMPVSGCLLFARNPQAAAFLAEAFAVAAGGGQPGPYLIEKKYWAIIEKSPEAEALPLSGELVHWLHFDSKTNKSFAALSGKAPDKAPSVMLHTEGRQKRLKKAILRYSVIGQGEHYLFLEIGLGTGRHHQIRAQLAAIGLHIKGDLKYGSRRSEKAGGIRLHARSLAFPNPANPGEIIRVQAPPPVIDSLWMTFASLIK